MSCATVDSFLIAFPEFRATAETQLTELLAMVELRIDTEFGDMREEAVYLELADTLATRAQGRPARNQRGGESKSVYRGKLNELRQIHALGRRLA